VAEDSIVLAAAKKVIAAGFFNDATAFQALMNSRGLFGYYKYTSVDFSVTMRTEDGTGSGYAVRSYSDVSNSTAQRLHKLRLTKP
jgi:predicted Zn-dependent protease